ncbi:hypothetical protein [Sphingobium aromaticivastans]|uniref:hypothetical protein n=1 Tax=Sphingobium aromaticivastans TaxID=1778665 RepID=UPI00159C3B0B
MTNESRNTPKKGQAGVLRVMDGGDPGHGAPRQKAMHALGHALTAHSARNK